jgi:hypothetical protein
VPEPEPRDLRDDPRITGDVALLRQVNPKRSAPCVDWSEIDALGRPRLRAGTFQRASLEFSQRFRYPVRTLSVFLEEAVLGEFPTVDEWAAAVRPGWGVVRISAGLVRSAGDFLIQRDDLNGWVGHSVAWAVGSNEKAEAAQKLLATDAEWVVAPDPALA